MIAVLSQPTWVMIAQVGIVLLGGGGGGGGCLIPIPITLYSLVRDFLSLVLLNSLSWTGVC
jgi:hypothetical protein